MRVLFWVHPLRVNILKIIKSGARLAAIYKLTNQWLAQDVDFMFVHDLQNM